MTRHNWLPTVLLAANFVALLGVIGVIEETRKQHLALNTQRWGAA